MGAGAALMLSAASLFATSPAVAGAADPTVSNCADLASALSTTGTVRLTGNLGSSSPCGGLTVGAGADVTLDLDGHTLTVAGTPGPAGAAEVGVFDEGSGFSWTVPATPGGAGGDGLTIAATASLRLTGAGHVLVAGGDGGPGGNGSELGGTAGGAGGAGIAGAGSLTVSSGTLDVTGGSGGTSARGATGSTGGVTGDGPDGPGGGAGIDRLATLTVTPGATVTSRGGDGGAGGSGGLGSGSIITGGFGGHGGAGGTGIGAGVTIDASGDGFGAFGGDGGPGGTGGEGRGSTFGHLPAGAAGDGGTGGAAGAGVQTGTVVSPDGVFTAFAGVAAVGGVGGSCFGDGGCVKVHGDPGADGAAASGIAAGATVTVDPGATWVVPVDTTIDDAGTVEVASGARIALAGSLTGTGTVSNLGTIAVASTGTVAPSLVVSGHHYAVSLVTSRGSVAPDTLVVYAASLADAGLVLPSPTGAGAEDFVAWNGDGGPLDATVVGETTDLSVGGSNLATDAPVPVTLRAGFSQTITFTSTAPADAKVGDTYEVTATGGGSGNPVVFSIAAGSTGCVITGATVSLTGVGTCVIAADQPGGGDYAAAPQAQQSFVVSAPADQGATVYGTVTEAGSGMLLSNVCVTLWDGPSQLRTTCSGFDGTWLMGNVAPGTYTLSFVDATGVHVTQWAGGAATQGASPAVVVESGAAFAQDAAMGTQAGTISGTVHHSPDHPTGAECVYLYHPGATGSYAGVATCVNPTGQYVLSGMTPGDYVVAFTDPLGLTPTLWSGGANTQADATTITVGASATTGVDVTPQLAADVIAGQVTDPSGTGLANICVYAYSTDSVTRTLGTGALAATCTNAQGGYVLSGVPDWNSAEYQVAFVDPTGTYPTQWASPVTRGNAGRVGANHWAAPRFVWGVSMRDGTTPYVSVRLHPGGSISGTVTDAATGAPRAGACVYVDYASDGAYVGRGAVTDASGNYTIENLAPTRDATVPGSPGYKVGFYADCAPGQSPTHFWNGGASFEGSAPNVDVTSGADTGDVDAEF